MELTAYGPGETPADVVAGVHETLVAALAVDEPERPLPAPQDTTGWLTVQRPGSAPVHLVLSEADRVLGHGRLGLPGRDNTHLGFLDLTVRPDARRRGVGTTLVRAAVDELVRRERRTLLLEAASDSPASGFCDSLGLEVALSGRTSLLRLPGLDPDEIAALAAAEHPGYRLRGWSDGCPEELLESYARAKSAMNDAPLGSMDWEGLRYSGERQREDEAFWAQVGRQIRCVAAVHADSGEVVALTEILVSRWSPTRAEQDDTAVVPAHRGHGLGLWIKAEMLHRTLAERPDVVEVTTHNSMDNDHMWRINERLGFRAYLTGQERQGRVPELAALLSRRAVGAPG